MMGTRQPIRSSQGWIRAANDGPGGLPPTIGTCLAHRRRPCNGVRGIAQSQRQGREPNVE